MKKRKEEIKCKAPIFSDIYRDGGSYGFGFGASDGKVYELHLKVVIDSPVDCKRYFEPIIFKGTCNSKEAAAHLTWKEAEKLIANIKYDDLRFHELKWIIQNGGWAIPQSK